MNVTIDAGLIAAAAAAAGVDPEMTPGAQVRAMLTELAGIESESRSKEGGELKRSGREFERAIVAHANERFGFGWDVAPLRGRRDLLDVTGCLPGGWLIGAKARQTGVAMDRKLFAAMDQCHRAMDHLPRNVDPARVIPVQVVQRRSGGPGGAYAVTEYDWLLNLAEERRQMQATLRTLPRS